MNGGTGNQWTVVMTIIRRYQIAVVLVALFGISIFAYRGRTGSNIDEPAPSRTTASKPTEKKAVPQKVVAPLSGGLDIPQSIIASGGDTSTGDVLSLTGTIGQYATDTSTGGGLTLTS